MDLTQLETRLYRGADDVLGERLFAEPDATGDAGEGLVAEGVVGGL